MTVLIELQKACLAFRHTPVLENIDFTIHEREICTLIGPNGAGKSSLVKLMTGLLKANSGRVIRKPKLSIGYVPQKLRLDSSMPLSVQRFLSSVERDASSLQQVLERLNIGKLEHAQIHNLSGGELQRVLLARAILRHPQLLVLDEPLQGVDVNGQASLYRLIASLRDELGCAIVMVSHDLHLVMAQSDSVVCLNHHVCCHGKPESVSQHPEYLRLFGHTVADNIAVYTHHHDHHHDLHGEVVDPCEHTHD